jgi:hypothetical protein
MSRLAKMLWVLYPTNRATRILFAGKEYDKGQVIIKEEVISKAKMILYRSHLSTRTTGKIHET